MTADAREKLAAALADNFVVAHPEMNLTVHELADALLPVVDEIAGKRAAEAEAERDYWKTEAITLTSMAADNERAAKEGR